MGRAGCAYPGGLVNGSTSAGLLIRFVGMAYRCVDFFMEGAMDENTVLSNDPLKVYLWQVGQIPPLDNAEESTCIDHVRAGDDMARPPPSVWLKQICSLSSHLPNATG